MHLTSFAGPNTYKSTVFYTILKLSNSLEGKNKRFFLAENILIKIDQLILMFYTYRLNCYIIMIRSICLF